MSASPYEVCLHLIPGIGPQTSRLLLQHFSSAENLFHQSRQSLLSIDGIGPCTAQLLLDHHKYLQEAETLIAKTQKEQGQLLFFMNADYPTRLKQIPDAPVILFHKGQDCLNRHRTIAIVGTRKPTEYGKQVTNQLISELQPWNPVIVSGMAYGIDITAHRAALQQGLQSIAVLAHGLNKLYPQAHHETANKLLQQGALLTEYGWGKGPEPAWFAARNRIIAGLSAVTIVVEAAEKGGALITAACANSYDREVMTFSGRSTDPMSAGCLKLIKNHEAHLIRGAQDLVELMGWNEDQRTRRPPIIPPGLSDQQLRVLQYLIQHADQQIDELCFALDLNPQTLSLLLLELEMQGLVCSLPGKRYKGMV